MSDPHGVLATPVTTLARNAAGGTGSGRAGRAGRGTRGGGGGRGAAARPCAARTGRRSPPPAPTASALAARIAPVPVVYVDERLTTVSADRHAHRGRGARQGAARKVVDQVAATRILQNRLDKLAGGGAR